MEKIFYTCLLLLSLWVGAFAQQDAMLTKYMFNTLAYNPAYAGTRGYASMGVLHRTQWLGINDAPSTQIVWAHKPMQGDKIGIGIAIMNDKIGSTNATTLGLSYSYIIPIGEKHKLSMGVRSDMQYWRADWSHLEAENANDEAYAETSLKFWLPNFGVGLYYYYQNHFYLGLSTPRIVENDLRKASSITDVTTAIQAKQYRHYFVTAGGAIPLNSHGSMILKPSALFKAVGLFSKKKEEDSQFTQIGAPMELDVNVSVLMHKTLWVGLSLRSAIESFSGKSSFDSMDTWVQYVFKKGVSVGLAYDYGLNRLQRAGKGSFEVMVGYDINVEETVMPTPRYF